MRLKSLYIQGFKSFAKKTKIEFNDKITCIVGPNGSGKSNIADAIMWVLGESSAKSLRGDKMEDVIFSGTDNKKSLSLAEVTIVFDNSDRLLDLDYDTISVTRRMYRSGETEFLINNTKCRLKDIKELFMDTGIGKDGYSLIGQGKIGSILNVKADQRRSVFDEAAGISKYKMRKQQSESKLKNTEDNIIRLNDIISQMEERKNSLKSEAERAKKFQSLSNKLKTYELADRKNKLLANKKRLDNVRLKEEENKKAIEELERDLASNKEDKRSLESKLEENKLLVDQKQAKFYEINSEIEKNKSRLDLILNRAQDLKESTDTNKQTVEKESFLKEALKKESLDLENKISEKNEEKQELIEKSKAINEILNKKLEEEKEQEEINRKESEKKLENHRQKSFIESRLNLSESLIKDRQDRLEAIEKNLNILNKNNDEILLSKQKHLNEINKLSSQKSSLATEISKIKQIIEEKSQELDQKSLNYEHLKTDLSNKNAKFLALKNISDNYEGYSKSVKSFMNSVKKEGLFKNNLLGPLAENIRVDKKYEKAISISLGYAQQNIIIRDDSHAKEMVNYLNKNKFGRITFLPINALKIRKSPINLSNYKFDGLLGFANEFLEYDQEIERVIEFLLGKIIICKDFSSAKKVSDQFKKNYRVVSLEGDSFNVGGSITAGENSKSSSNILARQIELDNIRQDLKNLKNQDENIRKEISGLKEEIKKHQGLFTSYTDQDNDLANKLEKSKGYLNNLEDTKLSNDKYIKDYLDQKNILLDDIENNQLENEKYRKNLKEIENLITDDNKSNEEAMKIIKTDIEDKKNEKISIDIKLVELSSEIKALENEVINKKSSIDSKSAEILDLKNKIEKADLSMNEASLQEQELSKQISNLCKDKDQIYKELEDAKSASESLKEESEELNKAIEEKRDKLVSYEKEILKIQAKFEKFKINIQSSLDFIKDKYEIDLENYQLEENSENLKNISDNIDKIYIDIKNLGQVNILAINDYKSLMEEYEFNLKQKDDLLLSRKEILNVILELEDEMQKSFKATFNKVAKYFNEIFIQLFNGGQAKISIVGDNLLESGIEINVQPPGKKLQSLSLLSGGERSLTAVALLFAFLKVRPAPFCILDEIDAALDDNNIMRYADYINNISGIQFIIITHRKLSMEIANVLYGITMEEKGVSKLISVKLKK